MSMSGLNLNTLTENASRLGQRLQETLSERTKELTLPIAGSSYLDTAEDKLKNIRNQLDSNSDREKLEAMKRLIALISKGRNVSEFFAQVVKNVASHNLEIRKLVYIYLLRYAEAEPDLALLSINTFQKDLTDSNPLIRAMALRVLSGIQVPMIGSIIVLAIKKCAADVSPYVRKAAALAIPKCYNLDSAHLPALIDIISSLLKDRSPLSLGSVAVAYEATCPTRLDLLHQHYRRLCRTLVDVDEWGQVNLMDLLIRYARTMLPRPVVITRPNGDVQEEVDPDLQLLISSSEPLLQSRNCSVVLAAIRVCYYLGPPSHMAKTTKPLLRLLVSSKEVERVVLAYILVIARSHQALFSPHYSRFIVLADDLRVVKSLKMRLLVSLVSSENYQALLREFIDYTEDTDDQLVHDAIHAIAHCARLIPSGIQQCLTALMGMIRSKHEIVVSSSVVVLKLLVQSQLAAGNAPVTPIAPAMPETPLEIISQLAWKIDDIRHPHARSCVVWLVGQYAAASASPQENGATEALTGAPEGLVPWAADVLRKMAKTFNEETVTVRLHVVTLAAKLLVLCPNNGRLELLARYVFLQARYDANYDVRDRARMLSTLLSGVVQRFSEGDAQPQAGVVLRREQVRLVLFDGKGAIEEKMSWAAEHGNMSLGSLETITGKAMRSDRILPDWLEHGVDSSLRDAEDDLPAKPALSAFAGFGSDMVGSGSGPRPIIASTLGTPETLTPKGSSTPVTASRAAFKDLDSFYADADDDGSEEESEEEEEEGSDEEAASDEEEGGSGEEETDSGEEHDGNAEKQ